MFLRKSLLKRFKVPLLLMLMTILLSFVVPSVLATPENPQKKFEAPVNSDLAYNMEAYFTLVNYNEPTSPWVLVNYYYENGSYIRMIFGVENVVFPSLDLNLQYNIVQVFDNKGKLSGYGFKTRSKSNLFIFVPA
ncbi:MAG: hypothetical protein JSV09_11370 [Thermoplasmata archaeon]|nr:MAG: hypothetical protein JSV09_11370 [Thermoplasmata archaeon]